jgi:hypothetical protein
VVDPPGEFWSEPTRRLIPIVWKISSRVSR